MSGPLGGRPTVRTPQAAHTVKEVAKLGLSWATCAKVAGISERALRNWRTDDPTFADELDQARATMIASVAARMLEKALCGDTAAMRFILSRLEPSFADRAQLDVTVSPGPTPPSLEDGSLQIYLERLNAVVEELDGKTPVAALPAPEE